MIDSLDSCVPSVELLEFVVIPNVNIGVVPPVELAVNGMMSLNMELKRKLLLFLNVREGFPVDP